MLLNPNGSNPTSPAMLPSSRGGRDMKGRAWDFAEREVEDIVEESGGRKAVAEVRRRERRGRVKERIVLSVEGLGGGGRVRN